MWLGFNIPWLWGWNDDKKEETKIETDKSSNPDTKENTSTGWAFSIPETEQKKTTTVKSATKKIEIKQKLGSYKWATNYTRQWITLFVFWIFSFIFYMSYSYVKLYDTIANDLPIDTLVTEYESYETQLNDIIHIYSPEMYDTLPTKWKQANTTITQVIWATDINYIHKWKILTNVFKNLSNETISLQKKIEQSKWNITKYWFSPKEINDILWWDETDHISLQRSLLSLEVIKFSTAVKVFWLLYTFLDQFSHYYSIDTTLLRKKMAFYSSRTEIDIERYLQSCYLNPFEDLRKCSFIWDFDNYYTFFEPQTDINPWLFKELMSFIDQKLTETSFPSLAITFNQFNPQSKSISFKVLVNTFQNDEKELINQWIISPHIFVVTSIINLLKQSNFILGEAININDMKIDTNTIEIWWKEFTVHSSTRNFDLPIQPEVQVEIFDYTPDVSVYSADLLKDKTNVNLDKYWSENKSNPLKQ